ncbi:HEAT repeat domain-containing protein [Kitasatospora mediocidica]|uniref:HEAT repeat domain-containing protein n=1 Tax=Kitasatospora mediocidica TaxID=58352 RepID=UPI00056AC60A|nr:HEAT repeat domain-containing protein [Kitasatospora mediocidica]
MSDSASHPFAVHYRSLPEDERCDALYGLEAEYTPELFDVLCAIAADQDDDDLARIEAVKVLCLSDASADAETGARLLAFVLGLVVGDPDDDVRLHALHALQWLPPTALATPAARACLLTVARTDSCPLVREDAQALVEGRP